MPNEATIALKKEIRAVVLILGISLIVLWCLFLVNALFLGSKLNMLGIHPRTKSGLLGILIAPLLHGSLFHIINNSFSFILFGTLLLLNDIWKFVIVTVIAGVISGIGIWLIGSSGSVHIGASGIILGYFGYCVSVGFIEKKLSTLIFSLIIIFLYGGMIFAIIPGQMGISWEGHLFGFIGGICSASLIKYFTNSKQEKIVAKKQADNIRSCGRHA